MRAAGFKFTQRGAGLGHPHVEGLLPRFVQRQRRAVSPRPRLTEHGVHRRHERVQPAAAVRLQQARQGGVGGGQPLAVAARQERRQLQRLAGRGRRGGCRCYACESKNWL
jgi:hypothetical protein